MSNPNNPSLLLYLRFRIFTVVGPEWEEVDLLRIGWSFSRATRLSTESVYPNSHPHFGRRPKII